MRHSPAARCSCRLDGVNPEAVGDVPQCLQCLLVRFVVILHEGKMSSSSAAQKKGQKTRFQLRVLKSAEELHLCPCACVRVCVCVCEGWQQRERE